MHSERTLDRRTPLSAAAGLLGVVTTCGGGVEVAVPPHTALAVLLALRP